MLVEEFGVLEERVFEQVHFERNEGGKNLERRMEQKSE
jgi:hypothetical protein